MLHTQEAQYNLYINGTLRPGSNCQVSKLAEDVNYIQKSARTINLLQHGRRSGAEGLLIKRNISTAKVR